MKRNMLVAAGIALILAFAPNTSRAQNDAPQPAPAPAVAQPPGPFPDDTNQPPFQRPPPRFGRQRPIFARALGDLRMAKMELQRSQGDLGGHKNSALEACDKAIEELTAVMKSLPVPPPTQRPIQPPVGTPPPATPLGAPPATPPGPATAPAQPPQ